VKALYRRCAEDRHPKISRGVLLGPCTLPVLGTGSRRTGRRQSPNHRKFPLLPERLGEAAPSTINEKTIADFTRVVEQTGILRLGAPRPEPRDGD
jgi:hypothetical protein